MWWCTSLILALSRQRMAQLYDVFFFTKTANNFIFIFHNETCTFLSHFSPSKLFCQERGSLPCHAARRHSGSALWSLVKQNKKYKTDEETFCSYPSGQVRPSQVGTIIWRAGGIIMGGPEIMGMWPPMGGLIPEAGPPGIIPGGEGPIIASWEYILLPSNQEMIDTLRLTRAGKGQKPVQWWARHLGFWGQSCLENELQASQDCIVRYCLIMHK